MASACALAIFSGRIIFNFAFVAACGPLQTHFHGRGYKGELHLQRLFPAETSALRGYPFRLAALRQSTFPKGTASVAAGNFAAAPERRPLGRAVAQRLRG